MVSLALLLLTVSTLATLSNALPTEIRHECEGRALCHIKPEGYPQDEIDSIVLKQLSQLPRMKREIPDPQPTWVQGEFTPNGNCDVIKTENMPLFTVQEEGSLAEVIVQSKWFTQTITEVKCAKDAETSGCFSEYAKQRIETKCETKYMQLNLTAYDLRKNRLKSSIVKIGIDCACVLI